MNWRFPIAAAAVLVLCGCETSSAPVPEGYDGPLAHIGDTMAKDGNGIDFFFVERVNGKRVENSLDDTVGYNQGMGAYMRPQIIGRDVPAGTPSTFTIKGRTHYSMPILEMAEKVHELAGEVSFTPQRNHRYLVVGTFGDRYSAVWIEDAQTGGIMDHKIETNGPATLGFFEK